MKRMILSVMLGLDSVQVSGLLFLSFINLFILGIKPQEFLSKWTCIISSDCINHWVFSYHQ